MAVACSLRNFEECLRNTANEKGVRVSEYFLDFDKLRSGKVTDNIFFRILTQNFGITLNEEQRSLLRGKYGVGDKINWRKFVDEIDKTLDPNNLTLSPKQQLKRIRFHETECLPKNFSDVADIFRPILSRINQHITYNGYTIRQCYKQFDNQNIGKVSESQFYRSFPGPKDISEAELCALAKHYSVPNDPGMVDYLRLEQDLRDLAQAEKISKEGYPPKPDAPDIHINTKSELLVPSVHMVLERIGFAVYTRGIRVLDLFLDYDPLRHDEVSEHQFACVLNLTLSEAAQLSRFDIQQLANFFRSSKNPDKIAYREFCRAADFPFHIMDLEKKPLCKPEAPPPGALSRPLQNLTEDEEVRVSNILSTLREKVRTQRIQTYPIFRDYDTSTALTRTMTPMQMSRALHFLRLNVGSEDCRLLAKKFADPVTKYVNYAALCEAIDPMFQASAPVRDATHEIEGDAGPPPKIGDFVKPAQRCDWDAVSTPIAKSCGDSADLETLMARIRHLVLVNRIRLKGFFEDFDPLRSGRITKDQFMRALSNASINRIGLHDLTPAQCNKLLENYISSEDPKTVRWLDFVNDVDTVFTLPELEKRPLVRVPPQETFLVPKPGMGDWSSATEEMRENYEHGMRALRRCVLERSLQLKPEFLAFDKLNRGHVTLNNFRQIISMLNIHLPVEDLDVIAARYADDDGFNYAAFILDLIPLTKEQLHYKYPDRVQKQRLKYLYEKKQIEREPVMRDAEGVLDKIKKKVHECRIRLSEWIRDSDRLNHGTVSRQAFRRALGLLPIPLKETELNVLEHYYKAKEENFINWRAFCDEVESVFATPNFEKDPLKEAQVFKTEVGISENYLPIGLAADADAAIKKIGGLVRQRRIQLTPLFSDFDQTHRMTLSQSQFRRCLMTLGLADTITEHEWIALYAKYRHPVGEIDNINYLAFSDDVYEVAGMVYRTP